MSLSVTVWGKDGCGRCEDMFKKIKERYTIPVNYKDMQFYFDVSDGVHDGWRKDGTIDAMAAYQQLDLAVPIMQVGDKFYKNLGDVAKLLKEYRREK